MSRAKSIGRVAVVGSSMMLAGGYIAYQAGWVRLPFISGKRPAAIMASSKVRQIAPGLVVAPRLFDAPPPPATSIDEPSTRQQVLLFTSKSGAVSVRPALSEQATSLFVSGSATLSPALSMPAPPYANALSGSSIVLTPPQPLLRLRQNGSILISGTLTMPSTAPTTQPLLPATQPSLSFPLTNHP